jgi:hypothetical protein
VSCGNTVQAYNIGPTSYPTGLQVRVLIEHNKKFLCAICVIWQHRTDIHLPIYHPTTPGTHCTEKFSLYCLCHVATLCRPTSDYHPTTPGTNCIEKFYLHSLWQHCADTVHLPAIQLLLVNCVLTLSLCAVCVRWQHCAHCADLYLPTINLLLVHIVLEISLPS